MPLNDPATGTYPTSRMEAFSDGVFAIAATLLVLDLAVPTRHELDSRSLASALGHQWPAFFAYLVSFLVIGVIWVNHHAMCQLAHSVDRVVLFANLALLLVVSAIPFPTHVLADYLTDSGSDSHTAAALYSATMTVMGFAFTGLFLAFARNDALLQTPLSRATMHATLRRFSAGSVVYLATVGLAFVNAIATLAAHAALGVYYCFDQLTAARQPASPE